MPLCAQETARRGSIARSRSGQPQLVPSPRRRLGGTLHKTVGSRRRMGSHPSPPAARLALVYSWRYVSTLAIQGYNQHLSEASAATNTACIAIVGSRSKVYTPPGGGRPQDHGPTACRTYKKSHRAKKWDEAMEASCTNTARQLVHAWCVHLLVTRSAIYSATCSTRGISLFSLPFGERMWDPTNCICVARWVHKTRSDASKKRTPDSNVVVSLALLSLPLLHG